MFRPFFVNQEKKSELFIIFVFYPSLWGSFFYFWLLLLHWMFPRATIQKILNFIPMISLEWPIPIGLQHSTLLSSTPMSPSNIKPMNWWYSSHSIWLKFNCEWAVSTLQWCWFSKRKIKRYFWRRINNLTIWGDRINCLVIYFFPDTSTNKLWFFICNLCVNMQRVDIFAKWRKCLIRSQQAYKV